MMVVMGVLILSFAVWGIADIFKGFGQSTLAKIGKTEISTEQFRQLYTEKLQQLGRQFGRPLTMDQARAFGLDRQVLQQTIAEAALDEEARRMGLGAVRRRDHAHDLPAIRISREWPAISIRRVSRPRSGSSVSPNRTIIAEQRRVSLRRQIAGTVSAGLEPPKVLIDALSRFQNEQRTIEYVKLDAAQAGTIEPPSPETLAAYFDDHKTQFRAPEYRKISFVAVTPEEIGKWSEVSDEDARKIFEQRPQQARHAGEAPGVADRVPERRGSRGGAWPPRGRNVIRRSRQGARAQPVRRRPRHDRQVGDHRRVRLRMRRSRCRPARSASPCRAGSASPWSRSARSNRAPNPPMKASPPT